MSAWALLTTTWRWDPSVLLGSAALIIAYLLLMRGEGHWGKAMSFISGVLVVVVALESPLDELGDTYLFSAHMLQHLLLLLIAPPLLLLGLPGTFWERLLRNPRIAMLARFLARPALAWVIGMGTIWVWHAPALYNAALADEGIHILEHLMFLISATIFWWPVLSPRPEMQMEPLQGIPYLFGAAASSAILGILLTFTPPGLYPQYLHPVDELRILPLLREQWGLSPRTDQQIGGLLMWVPGGLIYLSGILLSLGRWYRQEGGVVQAGGTDSGARSGPAQIAGSEIG
jgi:cytochrome c oxidase assembly factor CtaG